MDQTKEAEPLRLGPMLDHCGAELMPLGRPETYRKWVRQTKRGILFKPSADRRVR